MTITKSLKMELESYEMIVVRNWLASSYEVNPCDIDEVEVLESTLCKSFKDSDGKLVTIKESFFTSIENGNLVECASCNFMLDGESYYSNVITSEL